MGCIQAQDFAGAKWAIGCRLRKATDAGIEKDFGEGKILRTHVLRPTWHFVAPEDIRWMLQLSAPRLKAFNKGSYGKLGIDETALRKSKKIIEKVLDGGPPLTRVELATELIKKKINTDDIRLAYLLMDAELDGVICSGARNGKQFTYTLLGTRVLPMGKMDRQTAIAELAKRYFTSRGPVTLPDFAWWSGMTLSDAKKGIDMIKAYLSHESINGQVYWFSREMQNPGRNPVSSAHSAVPALPVAPVHRATPARPHAPVHLLPAFDEYAIAYTDRTIILPEKHRLATGNGIFKPLILVKGRIAGTWRRTEHGNNVIVEITPAMPLSKALQRSVHVAAEEYARFLGKELTIS